MKSSLAAIFLLVLALLSMIVAGVNAHGREQVGSGRVLALVSLQCLLFRIGGSKSP